MKFCQIIPNTILKNLKKEGENYNNNNNNEEQQEDLSNFIRETRAYLLEHPKLKAAIAAKTYKKTTHKETRRLFDDANKYKFATAPIATDEQMHSSKPSQHQPLELANIVYDYFHNRFDIESFDNKNSPIDVHVNFGSKYNNAFWDGFRLVFGTGDGTYFNTFLTQNILTHEFVHGITEHQCGLKYENQSGALNEHYSDVFAVCLDQRIKKQKPTEASWVIGEGIFTSKINAKGIRTFKPELAYDDRLLGKDPQPWHMKNYVNLPNTDDGDYGGVHYNSKICNHAFYLFCLKAEKEVGDERINYSWRAPAEIWFNTYKRLEPDTEFKQFAYDTISVCKRIHPQLTEVLKQAWREVGLYK
jgi:Zn-dependent metalloprotease